MTDLFFEVDGHKAVSANVEFHDLDKLSNALHSYMAKFRVDGQTILLEKLGGVIKKQTVTRFKTTKRDPDGVDWAPWSVGYAKTRKSYHSLLRASDDLMKSIDSAVEGATLTVFSDEAYSRAQNQGNPDTNLPARQYLGLSAADVRELEATVQEFLQ